MAAAGEPITLYGDWVKLQNSFYVEDHIDPLRLAATGEALGPSYFLGGHGDCINKQVVEAIRCEAVRQRAGYGGGSTWRNSVDTASSTLS